MTSEEQKELPIAAQPRKNQEKVTSWWAIDGPVVRFSVQLFLLICGCLFVFLAEQAHEIHVQAELKAVRQHLSAYSSAVGNSKGLSDQVIEQQREMERVHQSFTTEKHSLDNLKKTFGNLKATSDDLEAKVKGAFESFSGEIALLRAQTTPDGKSEEIFEAQRYPLLWDQVKKVLERVDKAKPEQIAKLDQEIKSLQAKLKSANQRVNSIGAHISGEHTKKLAALKVELKALQEDGTPPPDNIIAHALGKPVVSPRDSEPPVPGRTNVKDVSKLAQKPEESGNSAASEDGHVMGPTKQDAKPEEKEHNTPPGLNKNVDDAVAKPDMMLLPPMEPKPKEDDLTPLEEPLGRNDQTRSNVVQQTHAVPADSKPVQYESGKAHLEDEKQKLEEAKKNLDDEKKKLQDEKKNLEDAQKNEKKKSWDAHEILKQAGAPINISSIPPKPKTAISPSPMPSHKQSPERCPESCMSKPHSCWLVRTNKSGSPVGKCYIGFGKLSGHTKEMTQSVCEDDGGAWCPSQTRNDLEEAMARDPGPKKLADAVRAALAAKHKIQPPGQSALMQIKKEQPSPALRKRLPQSHAPAKAVSLFR